MEIEEEGDSVLMFCAVCRHTHQKNGFTRGCKNFHRSALDDHSKSQSHRHAIGTAKQQQSVAESVSSSSTDSDECLNAQMRTVLHIAKENLAATKFESLIELQRANGCSALATGVVYKHHESVKDMEEALVQVTKEEVKEKVDRSDYVGLVFDETLNCTLDKKLIVFARIVLDGSAETVFLGNYTIDNGTAECVYGKVQEVLAEWYSRRPASTCRPWVRRCVGYDRNS